MGKYLRTFQALIGILRTLLVTLVAHVAIRFQALIGILRTTDLWVVYRDSSEFQALIGILRTCYLIVPVYVWKYVSSPYRYPSNLAAWP